MTGSFSFLNKAAELKRFRLHPLSSADTRNEQEESGASITEELKCTIQNHACEDQPPGHHNTHGPLGINKATCSDGDTCSGQKAKLHKCEEVVQRSIFDQRLDIVVPTDPSAPTKPPSVTETPAVGTKPSITNAQNTACCGSCTLKLAEEVENLPPCGCCAKETETRSESQPPKLHPATKQLDGRMQPQALPSSLTVVPVFMASGHPANTSAMPSNSTLPYAAKQLDDTSINSRTQSFTRQLNASSLQPEPKTKQSLHSNYQLGATNSQDDTSPIACNHRTQQLRVSATINLTTPTRLHHSRQTA